MNLETNRQSTGMRRLYVKEDYPIAWLVINNPARRNAMSLDMWHRFTELVEKLNQDPRIRAIVIRGEGDAGFISGADISEFQTLRKDPQGAKAYEEANATAFRSLRQSTIPTIAMIRGHCLGGGFGIAAACDIRIVAKDAEFGIPAGQLGLGYPTDAVKDVIDLIGAANARDLFFSARKINADEALEMRFVNRVVSGNKIEFETLKYVRLITESAPLTIKAAKAAINASLGQRDTEALRIAEKLADACTESQDYQEGIAAFLEKRKPVFNGK